MLSLDRGFFLRPEWNDMGLGLGPVHDQEDPDSHIKVLSPRRNQDLANAEERCLKHNYSIHLEYLLDH